MKFFAKFFGFFGTRIEALINAVSGRDILILSGLSLLGYGLYLLYPWLSFTVCGALILAGGFLMGE